MSKFIFVTGGVVSSLGKGITAASLAAVLESRGLKVTILKCDPYLNVDPGTMSPFQHGEVYVTEDGAETDLDLGHYERFLNVKMGKNNNITSGQIYENVIAKERRGDYLGSTVQVIPHVTDEIQQKITEVAKGYDITMVEIGGTIGDIESLPFLEAIRQYKLNQPSNTCLFIHLSLLPYIAAAGEIKTKPTQHSVKELRSIGLQPDILVCRSEKILEESDRAKISLFTNVEQRAVISCPDTPSIFKVPLSLQEQHLDDLVLEKLALKADKADLSSWHEVAKRHMHPVDQINIGMVGKYTGLSDAYKSLNEALVHAGIENCLKVNIQYIDAEELQEPGKIDSLDNINAIIVPGGFGNRGIEGKILAAKFARENKIPYLGICLGMQVAVIEYARNCANMSGANSTEFDPNTKYPVVALVTQWQQADGKIEHRNIDADLGGTLRKGSQVCLLRKDSLSAKIYDNTKISERHRHRYEVNSNLVNGFVGNNFIISGRSEDENLVEVIEISDHPWFIGCQFHPEFTSNPRGGHPLFNSFIATAYRLKQV